MRKHVLSIPIDWLSRDKIAQKLVEFVNSGKPNQITTVNPEFIVLSQQNDSFRQALLHSDLSLPDGTGIILAQTLKEQKFSPSKLIRAMQFFALGFQFLLSPESFSYKRITGVDLSEQIMELSEKRGWRVFLLGSTPGIAEKAGEIWKQRYPNLQIVGATPDDPTEKTVRLVAKAKPNVLLVAYGAPKQDIFIHQYKHELGAQIMVGIGGTFDTIVGTKYNPPSWIKRLGLEWFSYLVAQPKRYKRIWRSTVTYSRLIIDNATRKV